MVPPVLPGKALHTRERKTGDPISIRSPIPIVRRDRAAWAGVRVICIKLGGAGDKYLKAGNAHSKPLPTHNAALGLDPRALIQVRNYEDSSSPSGPLVRPEGSTAWMRLRSKESVFCDRNLAGSAAVRHSCRVVAK